MDTLILCGHNYRSHFGKLKKLREGDEVSFTDMDGNVFLYEVALVETLMPTAIEEMESGGWALTMFTCTIGGGFPGNSSLRPHGGAGRKGKISSDTNIFD